MTIPLGNHFCLGVSGIALHCLDISAGQNQFVCDAAVPLRYNYDKPEKPRRIKGFEVFSLIFHPFPNREINLKNSLIVGGITLRTNN